MKYSYFHTIVNSTSIVMDGARAHHDEQPIILAMDDGIGFLPSLEHMFLHLISQRELVLQDCWGNEGLDPCDQHVLHNDVLFCHGRMRGEGSGVEGG